MLPYIYIYISPASLLNTYKEASTGTASLSGPRKCTAGWPCWKMQLTADAAVRSLRDADHACTCRSTASARARPDARRAPARAASRRCASPVANRNRSGACPSRRDCSSAGACRTRGARSRSPASPRLRPRPVCGRSRSGARPCHTN